MQGLWVCKALEDFFAVPSAVPTWGADPTLLVLASLHPATPGARSTFWDHFLISHRVPSLEEGRGFENCGWGHPPDPDLLSSNPDLSSLWPWPSVISLTLTLSLWPWPVISHCNLDLVSLCCLSDPDILPSIWAWPCLSVPDLSSLTLTCFPQSLLWPDLLSYSWPWHSVVSLILTCHLSNPDLLLALTLTLCHLSDPDLLSYLTPDLLSYLWPWPSAVSLTLSVISLTLIFCHLSDPDPLLSLWPWPSVVALAAEPEPWRDLAARSAGCAAASSPPAGLGSASRRGCPAAERSSPCSEVGRQKNDRWRNEQEPIAIWGVTERVHIILYAVHTHTCNHACMLARTHTLQSQDRLTAVLWQHTNNFKAAIPATQTVSFILICTSKILKFKPSFTASGQDNVRNSFNRKDRPAWETWEQLHVITFLTTDFTIVSIAITCITVSLLHV